MFTSPEVIDEAGFVRMRLTLDESKNMETDRAKSQDTSEGMHDPKSVNIHEDTSEEPQDRYQQRLQDEGPHQQAKP